MTRSTRPATARREIPGGERARPDVGKKGRARRRKLARRIEAALPDPAGIRLCDTGPRMISVGCLRYLERAIGASVLANGAQCGMADRPHARMPGLKGANVRVTAVSTANGRGK